MDIRKESDSLRQEAEDILYKLLKLPDGFSSDEIDRLVDCIISSTRLDIAADFQKESRR